MSSAALAKVLTETIGAILVATLASFFLLGIVVTNVASYFKTFPNDKWYLKGVVALSLLLSLADTANDGALSYFWMVTSYGDFEALAHIPKYFAAMLAILGFVPFVVQLFFAWRLWKISSGLAKNRYDWVLPAFIVALSTTQLGIVLSNTYVWNRTELIADMESSIFPRAWGWIACLTAADLLISFSMIYYLVVVPRRDLKVPMQSQGQFMAIARRSVETNTITLILQIVLVVTLTTGTSGLWFIFVDKLTVKNYLFALISSLNGRKSGQGLGNSSAINGGLTSTKARPPGDINVSVVQDVYVESHELGAVPSDAYYRPARIPVSLPLNGQRGTGRSEERDLKTPQWGAAESV